MEPIVYKKGAFPANAATDGYIAYKVGWNDGIRKFNLFEQRKFGWQSHNTTFGAYDTFAEAYAAAEEAAARFSEAENFRHTIALYDREDNARDLLNSWGLSPEQKEELLSEEPLVRLKTPEELLAEGERAPAEPHKKQAQKLITLPSAEKEPAAGTISTVGDLRRALAHIPDSALLNIGTDDLGFEVFTAGYDGISVALKSRELEEDLSERSRNALPDERNEPSFRLPDGSYISAQRFEGDVAAHDKDQRTWQSIDIARYAPDGRLLDALCTVDYEDTLGLRSLVYANNDLEEPVFAHKHEISPVPAIPLDSIIKGAEGRRDTAQEGAKTKNTEVER